MSDSKFKIPATVVPALPASQSYGESISTLHVTDSEGHRRQFDANQGCFCSLYLSRPGIIGLLTPAIPFERPGIDSYNPRGLHVPGLFIVPYSFDPKHDWVLAVMEDQGCDPGWRFERILGRHELGSGDQLWNAMCAACKAAPKDVRFHRIQLPGSILGDPGL